MRREVGELYRVGGLHFRRIENNVMNTGKITLITVGVPVLLLSLLVFAYVSLHRKETAFRDTIERKLTPGISEVDVKQYLKENQLDFQVIRGNETSLIVVTREESLFFILPYSVQAQLYFDSSSDVLTNYDVHSSFPVFLP